ncbi:hypothetical protein TIFTF001_001227 [Ficus carica]|uniref:Uncharacterized protein n=1 Tax=Ficus carica TaxID=3494 RepID=A0AA87YYW9_FICCA|nr:hypothetical protein TIFTF001_001227 [Ficus carica]
MSTSILAKTTRKNITCDRIIGGGDDDNNNNNKTLPLEGGGGAEEGICSPTCVFREFIRIFLIQVPSDPFPPSMRVY